LTEPFPPPVVEGFVLPPELRRPFWRRADPVFAPIFLGSLVLHFAGAACVALTPRPPDDSAPESLERPAQRIHLPRLPPPAAPAHGAGGASRPSAHPSAAPAPTEVGLNLLLSKGAAGKALQDVLGETSSAGDVASALAGARRGPVVASAERSARGPSHGQAVDVGPIGGDGGGEVTLGAKTDRGPGAGTRDRTPSRPPGDFPEDELNRFMRSRLKAFQWCYERELVHHPDLAGRVSLRFTLNPAGRAQDIEFEEDTLGSDAVESCLRSLLRGWSFPVHPAAEQPLVYPLVFAHGH
jgi:hypothetical protein